MLAPHLVPTRAAAGSSESYFVLRLAWRWQWRRWRWTVLASGGVGDDDGFDVASPTREHLVQGGAGVRREMKAVCHLDRVGRALPTTFGVRTGAIADDDLDAWVMTQPIGEDLGGAIVEQIDRPVRLEINEQGSVAALFPAQGHVLNTQYPRATMVVGIHERMQNPQERVRAAGQASHPGQTSATLAAGLQRE